MMSEQEIERMAELIAIKVSERYLTIHKQLIVESIELHELRCANRKYYKTFAAISALVGGIVATAINLAMGNLF